MKNNLEIHLMFDKDILNTEISGTYNEIIELFKLVDFEAPIINFNYYKRRIHKYSDGSLIEYGSVDWYLKEARNKSNRETQISARELLMIIAKEPLRKSKKYIKLFVLNQDLYLDNLLEEHNNFVLGASMKDIGSIISINKFRELENNNENCLIKKYDNLNQDYSIREECFKTLIMHEVSHALGVPDRETNIENKIGYHCTNECIMRQGENFPKDWIVMTENRLKNKPFCDECEEELRNYKDL